MSGNKTNDLLNKIKKNSRLQHTEILSKSGAFGKAEHISTSIPMFNVALSGDPDLGFSHGISYFTGPSKHFKTLFCLMGIRSFQKKYPEGVVLFYDSEFGSSPDYFKSSGVDTDRVVHIPITNIEELTFDLMSQIPNLAPDDKIMIVIDSIGNLASKKEMQDAVDQKSVQDMTRAKAMKSLFRIITPHIALRRIPFWMIGHVYDTQEMYSKKVVSGGQGPILASDQIFIIGRQQEKEGTEISGYTFVLNVEKSRRVKEKSKIPIEVSYESGISKWSGLLDTALEGGFVVKPNQGWFQACNPETGEILLSERKFRRADTNSDEFWNEIFEKTIFREYLRKTYQLSHVEMLKKEEEHKKTLEEEVFDSSSDDETPKTKD